jgi:hypothetical protein
MKNIMKNIKNYISKLTVFLSLFCFRGVLAEGVVDFFVGSGFLAGASAGKLTVMVFKPDSKSLISVGPFISGRVERGAGSFWSTRPNCS